MIFVGSSGSAAQDARLSSAEGLSGEQLFTGGKIKDVFAAQVLLDHSGHSPGVIDGAMGRNTARAIKAYQRASGMTVDGELSDALL